jgi:hypothetical protein
MCRRDTARGDLLWMRTSHSPPPSYPIDNEEFSLLLRGSCYISQGRANDFLRNHRSF